jgi:acyl dehydratase
MTTQYFEDYVVGAARTTFGRTITDADFVVHAGHSGDFFPHHMDEVFAAGTPFKRRIAHGTMVLTIGVGLTAGVINPVAFTYGYDRIRFVKPVFIGDTIRTVLAVHEKTVDPKRPGHGRVVERGSVLNQHGETVLAFDHLLLVEKRPAAEG